EAELKHLLRAGREGNVAGGLLLALADDVLHLLAHGVEGDAETLQRLGGYAFALVNEAGQDVLSADVVVVEHLRLFLGEDDDPTGVVGKSLKHFDSLVRTGRSADAEYGSLRLYIESNDRTGLECPCSPSA